MSFSFFVQIFLLCLIWQQKRMRLAIQIFCHFEDCSCALCKKKKNGAAFVEQIVRAVLKFSEHMPMMFIFALGALISLLKILSFSSISSVWQTLLASSQFGGPLQEAWIVSACLMWGDIKIFDCKCAWHQMQFKLWTISCRF
jgi:hypothetical protein